MQEEIQSNGRKTRADKGVALADFEAPSVSILLPVFHVRAEMGFSGRYGKLPNARNAKRSRFDKMLWIADKASGIHSAFRKTFNRKVEVSFGEYISGASPVPKILLGASNSRSSCRIDWNRARILCAHRQPKIS